LSKCDILGNTPIEVMGNHQHIQSLFERVQGVGTRRGRGRWDHIGLTAYLYDVRRMSATGPLGVKGVDSSTFESCDRIFYKTALVQRVCVDEHLDIHVIGDGKAAIDGGGGSAPVLMKLKAARPSLDLLNQTRRQACIAFAEETEIDWKGIGSL